MMTPRYRYPYCHREEGILVISGGLTIHNLQDRTSFIPSIANPLVREFNDAVSSAISISNVSIPHTKRLYIHLHIDNAASL
jgi:aromatic ring-opening dioxygenase catalytic subunit (LigB family)